MAVADDTGPLLNGRWEDWSQGKQFGSPENGKLSCCINENFGFSIAGFERAAESHDVHGTIQSLYIIGQSPNRSWLVHPIV